MTPNQQKDLVELVARALCTNHGTDPDSVGPQRRHTIDVNGIPTIITDHMGPLWKMYISDAKIAISTYQESVKSEPVAMRYGWDGDGWQYIDNGSGSDWRTRHKDAEQLYLAPGEE